MERDSLSFRLFLPANAGHAGHAARAGHAEHAARAITDVVPALVRDLRSADADGRWHFTRAHDGTAEYLDVVFEAAPAVIDALGHRLRRQSDKHECRIGPLPGGSAARRPTAPTGAALSAGLAAAASDFALALLGGGLSAADHPAAALLALRLVTRLLPASARAPFLFHGWQLWSRPFTPARRRELAEQADLAGYGAGLRAPADWRPDWVEPWDRYGRAVAAAVDEHAASAGGLLPYLLFQHARLTHDRLGIPAAEQAVAARAARAALTAPEPAARPVLPGTPLPVPQPA